MTKSLELGHETVVEKSRSEKDELRVRFPKPSYGGLVTEPILLPAPIGSFNEPFYDQVVNLFLQDGTFSYSDVGEFSHSALESHLDGVHPFEIQRSGLLRRCVRVHPIMPEALSVGLGASSNQVHQSISGPPVEWTFRALEFNTDELQGEMNELISKEPTGLRAQPYATPVYEEVLTMECRVVAERQIIQQLGDVVVFPNGIADTGLLDDESTPESVVVWFHSTDRGDSGIEKANGTARVGRLVTKNLV
jgi:hypothetical protein